MDTAQMAELYAGGLNSNEIAAHAGVSGRTVLRRLHAAGVQLQLRPLRQTRPLCARCKKTPVTGRPRNKYCGKCYPLHPVPTPRRCPLASCQKLFKPSPKNRDQRFCCAAHWYASKTKHLDQLVRDGTFRAYRGEELLEKEDLDEDAPEILRDLQRHFRAATSKSERRALAQCLGRIARARAR
jgi:hypothetical protein